MDSIPEELWEIILSYLNLTDKSSCCRLNKRLSSEAIKLFRRSSGVSLKTESQLLKYMDYLKDGGRLHGNIELTMQPKQLVDKEKYEEILKILKPGVVTIILELSDPVSKKGLIRLEVGPESNVSVEKLLKLIQDYDPIVRIFVKHLYNMVFNK